MHMHHAHARTWSECREPSRPLISPSGHSSTTASMHLPDAKREGHVHARACVGMCGRGMHMQATPRPQRPCTCLMPREEGMCMHTHVWACVDGACICICRPLLDHSVHAHVVETMSVYMCTCACACARGCTCMRLWMCMHTCARQRCVDDEKPCAGLVPRVGRRHDCK